MTHCIWCGREMPVYPATIPYIHREGKSICHNCIKRLAAIIKDQESRHERTAVGVAGGAMEVEVEVEG